MKRDCIFADFETTSPEQKTGPVHVYLWAFRTSGDDKEYLGTDIDDFLREVVAVCNEREQNVNVFFHNGARFDYHFLLYTLSKHPFRQVFSEEKNTFIKNPSPFKEKNTKKDRFLEANEGKMLVDNRKAILSIKFGLEGKKERNSAKGKHKYIEFKDTNLLFPGSLAQYGALVGVKKLDFDGFKKINTPFNSLESFKSKVSDAETHIEYILRDTEILKRFLQKVDSFFNAKLGKITSAGSAYQGFLRSSADRLSALSERFLKTKVVKIKKNSHFFRYGIRGNPKSYSSTGVSQKLMSELFPRDGLEEDTGNGVLTGDRIRGGYAGGISHVNPFFQGLKITKKEFTYADINSSYPFAMLASKIPYGEPCEEGDWHLLKITAKRAMSTLGLPFLQSRVALATSLNDSETTLRNHGTPEVKKGESFKVTSDEFERVEKYYGTEGKVEKIFSFKNMLGADLFGDYIHRGYQIKKEASDKPVLRKLAKIFLNSLYGKFGENPNRTSRVFVSEPNSGAGEKEESVGACRYFLPIAIAITSFARLRLVDCVGKNYRFFSYCDTDSLIVLSSKKDLFGFENTPALGAWKIETDSIKTLVLRHRKQYFYESKEGKKVAFASIRAGPDELGMDTLIYGGIARNQIQPFLVPYGRLLINYEKIVKPVGSEEYTFEQRLWFFIRRKKNEKMRDYYERAKKNGVMLRPQQLENIRAL